MGAGCRAFFKHCRISMIFQSFTYKMYRLFTSLSSFVDNFMIGQFCRFTDYSCTHLTVFDLMKAFTKPRIFIIKHLFS